MYKHINLQRLLFTKNKLKECEKDSKKIFSFANHLMGNKNKFIYPSSYTDGELAEKFVEFFANKVKKIQNELHSNLTIPNRLEVNHYAINPDIRLDSFDLVTDNETSKTIMSLPNKQCKLDPMPTWFLKNNHLTFSPIIPKIINTSLLTGIMPASLKTALVRPGLKNPSLDTEQWKSFRPISNLPILGKIIEKVVYKRLDQHISKHNLLDPNQSAYRKNHSAETTLLKLQNDVLCHLDEGHSVALVFIDISAAFDTANHEQLLKCFNQFFGIRGKALEWLKSYLTDRKQMVAINQAISSPRTVECGFPQGATLAGLMYNMSTAPFAKVVEKHPVDHKGFADDNGFYIAFVRKTEHEALTSLNSCLNDTKEWFACNNFKVNDDKTQLMFFSPRKDLNPDFCFTLGSEIIEPSIAVENLGVILDSQMTMENRINTVTQSVYYHIRNISKIRHYLTLDSARTIVQALVISRLDYCNSLFGNLPLWLTNKLKRAYAAA